MRQALTDLLVQTGKDHHQAFLATDGEDPDWPIWYAERLAGPVSELLGVELTRSCVVHCLMDAENDRTARSPEADWAPYYADYLIERWAAASTAPQDKLALYQFGSCPFCRRVFEVIDRLGLEVEMRDIHAERQHWDDLVAERGRGTVPVLKIDSPDGSERWMPESQDIIRYLEKTYGQGR